MNVREREGQRDGQVEGCDKKRVWQKGEEDLGLINSSIVSTVGFTLDEAVFVTTGFYCHSAEAESALHYLHKCILYI